MGHRRRVPSSFLSKLGEEIHPGKERKRLPFKRLPLRLEQFEPRLLMDGAGFVNTNPAEDPESVVGVAGVEAQDDYYEVNAATEQVRFDVLANDPQPVAGEGLRIKSVSETARGAVVSISDDGQRIIYTPELARFADTFYYIVEDTAGNLGKANVNVEVDPIPVPTVSTNPNYDRITVTENGPEQMLNVLRNDGPFRDGEIVELKTLYRFESSIRIADDGKSLIYQPAAGIWGEEAYEYTVRNELGETATHTVFISIKKPFVTNNDYFYFDTRPGPYILDILDNDRVGALTANDRRLIAPIASVSIVDVAQPEVGGSLVISEDGQRVIFTPDEGFVGSFTFVYTVRYGAEQNQIVKGRASIDVSNPFLAVNNWFTVNPASSHNLLDVLANDPLLDYGDDARRRLYTSPKLKYAHETLTIVEVSPTSHGGQIVIENGRSIRYTPQAGFTGEETFTYTVEDANGVRRSATVTVQVDSRLFDPTGVPKFASSGELEQFLLDQAVERYASHFGVYSPQFYGEYDFNSYRYPPGYGFGNISVDSSNLVMDQLVYGLEASFTNTQEAGVDEADIVETDGRYIYTLSNGKLAIVDLADPANPLAASLTEFGDHYTEMYLQGDRLTLISRGTSIEPSFCGVGIDAFTSFHLSPAVVTVLDISDRSSPVVVERTEIDGHISDSRAVGNQIYLTVEKLELPPLGFSILGDPTLPVSSQLRLSETMDEYIARIQGTLAESFLTTYRTFSGDGTLLDSGFLTDPTMLHKPVNDADNSLLSLVTFDVSDDQVGPHASVGIFTSSTSEVYMSGNSFYVMRSSNQETTIFKFSIDDEGTPSLVATGKVRGNLLNQFSVDEYEGRFRIATTEMIRETYINENGHEVTRQRERVNHLFVLEQNGATLDVVGSVENLAPTETIKSVRFMDDVAYVVTFRVIDPLFVIDLSDATNPTVAGSLKIPGYSDYLQPVGEGYLLGIGRDANEITGDLGPLQVSLFYVGDLSHPTLVDQVTMEGVMWSSSEAWWDHHAVSYFDESQVLALPVSWYEGLDYNDYHSAIWTFQIDVDQQGGGSLNTMGNVEHETQARRSVLLGTSLVTISQGYLKVNNLNALDEQLAVVDFSQIPDSQHVPGGDNSHPGDLDWVICYLDPKYGPQDPALIVMPVAEGELALSGWEGFLDAASPGDSILLDDQKAAIDPRVLPPLLEEELNGKMLFSTAGNDLEYPANDEGTRFSAESAIDAAFRDWELDTELLEGIPAEFTSL